MSRVSTDDTIAAIASPPGQGLRGIIRVSGPDAATCLNKVFASEINLSSCRSAVAIQGALQLTEIGEVADRGRADELRSPIHLPAELLWWPDHRSYTRQTSAEIHTIGNGSLLDLALGNICDAGARLAEPGEFTLRAFLSGRIDLTQAEAVLAVIDAGSDNELDQALSQLAGGLTGPLTDIRTDLISLLADLEAGLDFVEEDIEFVSSEDLIQRLKSCYVQLNDTINQVVSRDINQSEISAVLLGLPNAGKSSLFNALTSSTTADASSSNKAIVSSRSGTTRDYVTGLLANDSAIECPRVRLIDTAGIESTIEPSPANASDSISMSAQKKSMHQINSADLQILCIDGSAGLSDWDRHILGQPAKHRLVVVTKSDLAQLHDFKQHSAERFISTSSFSNEGVANLKSAILKHAISVQNLESSVIGSTAVRVKDSMVAVLASVARARDVAIAGIGDEVTAIEIRSALEHLGRVVGTIYTDDILEVVFSRFCVGK